MMNQLIYNMALTQMKEITLLVLICGSVARRSLIGSLIVIVRCLGSGMMGFLVIIRVGEVGVALDQLILILYGIKSLEL